MNINEKVTLRLGIYEDAAQLTNLHLLLFSPNEHVPVVFGEDYILAIYSWMLRSDETFVLVAEVNNTIVGFISACDSPYTFRMFISCLPDLVKSFIKKPGLIFNKILWKRLLRHSQNPQNIQSINQKELAISQIIFGGVDPNFRRFGIYTQINNYLKDYSKKRNIRAIRSEVYKENVSIRRYKENDGWIEVSELETTDTVTYMYFFDKGLVNEIGFDSLISSMEP